MPAGVEEVVWGWGAAASASDIIRTLNTPASSKQPRTLCGAIGALQKTRGLHYLLGSGDSATGSTPTLAAGYAPTSCCTRRPQRMQLGRSCSTSASHLLSAGCRCSKNQQCCR